MRSELNIIDVNNNKVIRFTDFNFQYDSVLRRILLNVTFDFEIFKAYQSMEYEEADFLYLRDGLEKIVTSECKRISFMPALDQRISLEFERNNTQIIIQARLLNQLFTGELKIKFETSLLQIKSLVNEIDMLLEN